MAKKQSAPKQPLEAAADQFAAAGKAALERAQEAVERAQEAVDKVHVEGSKLLNSLAEEGGKMKDQTQKMAEEMVDDLKEKVGEVRNKAADTVDNLEQIFEDRVSRVLKRLGIPTSDDFHAIAKRLEVLNESVKTLINSETAQSEILSSETDDLQQISGIGPTLAGKLYAEGIVNYRQVALWSKADIERVENEVIHSAGRISRDRWVEQAKALHAKKYQEQL
ncbi:MAG: phasin family protein [Candidatus Competibacteraceae bacterium]|nr:phasin family protein [Candidatus Competibacteraceae bacterium]